MQLVTVFVPYVSGTFWSYLFTLTCGCLVPNHAIRGLGGNHGVHGACVSPSALICGVMALTRPL